MMYINLIISITTKYQRSQKMFEWIGFCHLDMSLSMPMGDAITSLDHALPKMLPNLCEINMPNTAGNALMYNSLRCRRLEKVTRNNGIGDVSLNGETMKFSRNLKEIIMDDSHLCCLQGEHDEMSSLENHQNKFIFHECCKALERVSIRNAKGHPYGDLKTTIISQNALIKFVRNAPTSLPWFRSDLNQENIRMLQKERPGIELLN